MENNYAVKRHAIAEMWGKHYAAPIAKLIAVLVEPFDGNAVTFAPQTKEAHKSARRDVRQLFSPGQVLPSGGQIESLLSGIAQRFLIAAHADPAATQVAKRLESTLALLTDLTFAASREITEDLVVPDDAKQFDGQVPFAMWR